MIHFEYCPILGLLWYSIEAPPIEGSKKRKRKNNE